MRRFVLNFIVLLVINSVILPARALAGDDNSAELRAYVILPLDGDRLGSETTIGMQLRESSGALHFGGESAAIEAPLLDIGLKLNTDGVAADGAELLIFGAPVAMNDADLGLVWFMPHFDEAKDVQPAPAQRECALSRC